MPKRSTQKAGKLAAQPYLRGERSLGQGDEGEIEEEGEEEPGVGRRSDERYRPELPVVAVVSPGNWQTFTHPSDQEMGRMREGGEKEGGRRPGEEGVGGGRRGWEGTVPMTRVTCPRRIGKMVGKRPFPPLPANPHSHTTVASL